MRLDGVRLRDDQIIELGSLEAPLEDLASALKGRGRAGGDPMDAVFAATGGVTFRAHEALVAAGVMIPTTLHSSASTTSHGLLT